jgi:hypothetical protein
VPPQVPPTKPPPKLLLLLSSVPPKYPRNTKKFQGASSFGMSTIPETMAANALGLEVFAMSLITNLAAGMTSEILTHGAVKKKFA